MGWNRGARSGPLNFCQPAYLIVSPLPHHPYRDSVRKGLAAAGSAAAVFTLVAASVRRHQHAALGARGRAVKSDLRTCRIVVR